MELTESIVHEYSILYSTRILQKDKKWSDGMLRFYEFNYKLEVLNESQNLIATDFYPKNKKNPVASGFFHSGREFTLPSNRLVIEIDEYVTTYKRDISKYFKKSHRADTEPTISTNAATTKDAAVAVPRTRVSSSPVPSTNIASSPGPRLANNVLRRPRLGLSKSVASARDTGAVIKPKVQPRSPVVASAQGGIDTSAVIKPKVQPRPHIVASTRVGIDTGAVIKPKVQPRPHIVASTRVGIDTGSVIKTKVQPRSPGRIPTSITQDKTYLQKSIASLLRYEPKSSQRVLPHSSKHFAWLQPLDDSNTSSCASREASKEAPTKIKHELDSTTSEAIKSQGKSLDDADVIYDLTDFEDDEEFFQMLNQIRNEEKQQCRGAA